MGIRTASDVIKQIQTGHKYLQNHLGIRNFHNTSGNKTHLEGEIVITMLSDSSCKELRSHPLF